MAVNYSDWKVMTEMRFLPSIRMRSGFSNRAMVKYLVLLRFFAFFRMSNRIKLPENSGCTQKYPTFIEVTLWKKWDPEEASRGNPSRLVSTMTFAFEIC